VIVSGVVGMIIDMDINIPLRPPLALRRATSLVGRLVFGDSGVGGIPLDGDLALSIGSGESWQGKISTSALDAAEELWAQRRHADRVNADEARTITKAVVDFDADFYGLDFDWDRGRLDVLADGQAIRFVVPVQWADLLDPGVLQAMVRLELVNQEVTLAEFVLADGPEVEVLERQELALDELAGASFDAMSMYCRASLDQCLMARGLPRATSWQMNCTEPPGSGPGPGAPGSGGEVRVWTTFGR